MSGTRTVSAGFVVKTGVRYVGAGMVPIDGQEHRYSFMVFTSRAAATRAAHLVGGVVHQVYQVTGGGQKTPYLVGGPLQPSKGRRR